jgi:hypothetical protein
MSFVFHQYYKLKTKRGQKAVQYKMRRHNRFKEVVNHEAIRSEDLRGQ